MQISDSFVVDAPREEVWRFLNDAQSLARCLPGCEDVQAIDDANYQAKIKVQLAFISMAFDVTVRITNMDPPNSLSAEISGKPSNLAGRLKVESRLFLEEAGDQSTRVRYEMDMSMTGRLGSIGQPVFRSKAKEMGSEFAGNVQAALSTSNTRHAG